MNPFDNYPKKYRNQPEYVWFALKVTKQVINDLKNRNVLGAYYLKLDVYIPAIVTAEGYKVPYSVEQFQNQVDCDKACKNHNKQVGYSTSEVLKIIWHAMKTTVMPKEISI